MKKVKVSERSRIDYNFYITRISEENLSLWKFWQELHNSRFWYENKLTYQHSDDWYTPLEIYYMFESWHEHNKICNDVKMFYDIMISKANFALMIKSYAEEQMMWVFEMKEYFEEINAPERVFKSYCTLRWVNKYGNLNMNDIEKHMLNIYLNNNNL